MGQCSPFAGEELFEIVIEVNLLNDKVNGCRTPVGFLGALCDGSSSPEYLMH